jgi:hypothetical protein
MSNVFIEVGHVAETVGKDIIKAVDYLPHVISLLDTAIKDEPEVKTLIATLVTQASAVISTGTAAVSGEGVNLTADLATLASAEAFFTYFKNTFIPAAEGLYKDIAADIK